MENAFYLCASMKKVITGIALICYIAVTCGVSLSSHYCMNRLSSVHLFEKEATTCGVCGMDFHGEDGCCRNEVTIVQLQQDQNKLPVVAYSFTAPELTPVIPSVFIGTSYSNADEVHHFVNHSPPLLSAQDTYLQNNVFRI